MRWALRGQGEGKTQRCVKVTHRWHSTQLSFIRFPGTQLVPSQARYFFKQVNFSLHSPIDSGLVLSLNLRPNELSVLFHLRSSFAFFFFFFFAPLSVPNLLLLLLSLLSIPHPSPFISASRVTCHDLSLAATERPGGPAAAWKTEEKEEEEERRLGRKRSRRR